MLRHEKHPEPDSNVRPSRYKPSNEQNYKRYKEHVATGNNSVNKSI